MSEKEGVEGLPGAAPYGNEEEAAPYSYEAKRESWRQHPFFESVVERTNNQHIWFEQSGGLLSALKVGFSSGAPADVVPVEEYLVELEQSRYRSFELRFCNVSGEDGRICRFHVAPFLVEPSALPDGQRPVLLNSTACDEASSACWRRIGYDFEYIPLGQSLAGQCPALSCGPEGAYTLSFTVQFPADTSLGDVLILAYHQPYSVSDLERSISILETSPHVQRSSLSGRAGERGGGLGEGGETTQFPLLKITERGDEEKAVVGNKLVLKPVIILLARSGAADVMSSYAMEGCLHSLAFGKSQAMADLRKKFVFYALPMLNMGGVEAGNVWKDQHGTDLRKCYRKPQRETQPQVYYLKKLFRQLCTKHRRLLSVLELVGRFDKQHMYIEGVEEAAGEAAFNRKCERLQAAAATARHPFCDLRIPSPYDFVFHFMRREGKYFNHEACTFITKGEVTSARAMDARTAAAAFSHHPLCLNVVLCGLARKTASTEQTEGEEEELNYKGTSPLMCLSARKWFLTGRNVLLALWDVYRDPNLNNPDSRVGEECHAKEEDEPAGCILHPLWQPHFLRTSPSLNRFLESHAFQTAKMALTHGQSALARRHRSTVIREAFAFHFRKTKKPPPSTRVEEEASSEDEQYRYDCPDDGIHSSDEGSVSSLPDVNDEGAGACAKEKEKEKGKRKVALLPRRGSTKVRRDSAVLKADEGEKEEEEKRESAFAPAPPLETMTSKDNVGSRYRYTAFGKVGPAKKRSDEDYVVKDEFFRRTVDRYTLAPGALRDDASARNDGSDAQINAEKIPARFPIFADLIARDELQWLATHHPKRAGRSIRLDRQLGKVLSKQKQREQLETGSVEVHVPSFRNTSSGSEGEHGSLENSDNTTSFELPEAPGGDPVTAPISLEMPILYDSTNLVLKCTRPYPDSAITPPLNERVTNSTESPRLRHVVRGEPSSQFPPEGPATPLQTSHLPHAIIRDLRARQASPPHPAALHMRLVREKESKKLYI